MGDASGDFNHMENMQTMKKRKSSNPEDQGDWGDQVDRSKMNQKIADFKDEQKNHKVPEFNQDKILESNDISEIFNFFKLFMNSIKN